MAALVSKPGLTSTTTLSIPKSWDPAWFRGFINNQLKGGDVRNAVGANGISVTGNIASPYGAIALGPQFTVTNTSLAINVSTITGLGKTSSSQVDMAPDSGTFTGSITGCTAAVNATMHWVKIGNVVTLYGSGTGTSNATTMTMTGLPAAIQPTNSQLVVCSLLDSGANVAGVGLVTNSGTITFLRSVVSGTAVTFSSAGFTNAGTKGFNVTQFTYSLS